MAYLYIMPILIVNHDQEIIRKDPIVLGELVYINFSLFIFVLSEKYIKGF